MQRLIEAEPAPLGLDPTRTAFLIIDMQRDFLEPGGFGESRRCAHVTLIP